jgi:hypothetical protein
MHHAAVAVEELGGNADAAEVAKRLRWDTARAKTALLAAADHGLIGDPT